MNLLLDTTSLLWFLDGSAELPDSAAALIEAEDSRPLVSSVTAWEIAVKVGLGKLRLPYAIGEEFEETLLNNGFELLPISNAGLERTSRLPDHHRDPFDRLLAGEALEHNATIVSPNPIFDEYGVRRRW
ncbi:MAG: type II toxin-antitoxin system VapC family toxin [Verrucomicrobia bacterium]|nr:type II toxin-antitoxin system VapC family toxin [Verrucomicrobiota bacterium]